MELLSDEVLDDVDWHGEDDGGVVLGRDGAQGLEITQLEQKIFNQLIINQL